MKVDNPGTIMIPKAYSNSTTGRTSKTSSSVGGSPLTPTSKGDSVTLSDTTRDLQKVSVAMDSPPKERAEKVDALKNAIAKGEYQVSGEALAEKMLDTFVPDL